MLQSTLLHNKALTVWRLVGVHFITEFCCWSATSRKCQVCKSCIANSEIICLYCVKCCNVAMRCSMRQQIALPVTQCPCILCWRQICSPHRCRNHFRQNKNSTLPQWQLASLLIKVNHTVLFYPDKNNRDFHCKSLSICRGP